MTHIEKTLTRFDLLLNVALKVWAIAQIISHVMTGR